MLRSRLFFKADPSPNPSMEHRTLSQCARIAKVSLEFGLKLTDLVDNFQEEEAKVIVMSLVRSNHYGNVGILKTSNCINVLLR